MVVVEKYELETLVGTKHLLELKESKIGGLYLALHHHVIQLFRFLALALLSRGHGLL